MSLDPSTQDALRALGIASGGSHDDAAEPIDLRTIPRGQWEDYIAYPLLLPPPVAIYIAGLTTEPTVLEKDHIEEAVIAFHQIEPPYTAVFRNGKARLMRD